MHARVPSRTGRGPKAGSAVLSGAARRLREFDLGALASTARGLRPPDARAKRGLRGCLGRYVSDNWAAPYRGAKALLRCCGLRG